MFRRLLNVLVQVRYCDVPVPEWLFKKVNKKSLLEEAVAGVNEMKRQIVYKHIKEYFETVVDDVDVPSFIKAMNEMKRLTKKDIHNLYLQTIKEEVIQ